MLPIKNSKGKKNLNRTSYKINMHEYKINIYGSSIISEHFMFCISHNKSQRWKILPESIDRRRKYYFRGINAITMEYTNSS